jgi:hypothetical protein
MTTRWLQSLTPLIIASTIGAYGLWWAGSSFVRARMDDAFAARLGYSEAALLDRLTTCSGIAGNCRRKIGFTTRMSSEEFRDLVAQQGFKRSAGDKPAEPVSEQGEWLTWILSPRESGNRVTDSQGNRAAPAAWRWSIRGEGGDSIYIYFYETAGGGYRFDGRPIEGNVVLIEVKD